MNFDAHWRAVEAKYAVPRADGLHFFGELDFAFAALQPIIPCRCRTSFPIRGHASGLELLPFGFHVERIEDRSALNHH